MKNRKEYYFENFTEQNYQYLLQLAKRQYKFIDYSDYKSKSKIILWRHDVDFSMHRALKLAEIEALEGVKATYFINLHSMFFNALESEIAECIKAIIQLGHDIGVHFDPAFYSSQYASIAQLEEWLKFEKNILENIFAKEIDCFSFHNPDVGGFLDIKQEKIAGLINVYSSYFKENYGYCSDSNGYWRFNRLEDVLLEAKEQRLQVLTHPGWWVSEIMSPRDRITRCIEGRAQKQHEYYDKLLEKFGRENISKKAKKDEL